MSRCLFCQKACQQNPTNPGVEKLDNRARINYNIPMNQRNKEIVEIAEFYIPIIIALFITIVLHYL
jgi:hypothetical protein